MKKLDLKGESIKILNTNIINLLTQIHEYKGKLDLYIEAKSDGLSSL